jgi:hypothetical protein
LRKPNGNQSVSHFRREIPPARIRRGPRGVNIPASQHADPVAEVIGK